MSCSICLRRSCVSGGSCCSFSAAAGATRTRKNDSLSQSSQAGGVIAVLRRVGNGGGLTGAVELITQDPAGGWEPRWPSQVGKCKELATSTCDQRTSACRYHA